MTAEHRRVIQDDRCVHHLVGHFDAAAARALRQRVEGDVESSTFLVVDLRGLEQCERGARNVLVDVHRMWAAQVKRIAYLATEPRLRGLSLWIMHMAGDEQAKAVGSEAQVETWLRAGSGRQEQAFRTLGVTRMPITFARRAQLGLGERAATQAISWMMRLFMGFHPPWFDEVVKTHGIVGLKRLSEAVQSSLDELNKHYGELNGHALMAFTTLWNGCNYCSYGHLLAANMLYFQATGRLFPLSETDLARWQETSDQALADDVLARIDAVRFFELRAALATAFDLRMGKPVKASEPIVQTFKRHEAAWALINECSIVENLPDSEIPPFDPKLARNRKLLRAYRQARARQTRAE